MRKYKFYRRENGIWEGVEPVLWQWEAHYDDGSILKQYDDEGFFHQFKEIDQSRLKCFIMRNVENGRCFTLIFPPRAKLIHFYRNIIKNVGTLLEERERTFCFGYEVRGFKQLFVILPNGDLIITNELGRRAG